MSQENKAERGRHLMSSSGWHMLIHLHTRVYKPTHLAMTSYVYSNLLIYMIYNDLISSFYTRGLVSWTRSYSWEEVSIRLGFGSAGSVCWCLCQLTASVLTLVDSLGMKWRQAAFCRDWLREGSWFGLLCSVPSGSAGPASECWRSLGGGLFQDNQDFRLEGRDK